MNTTLLVEQRLLDKIRKLSPEKVIEVEDFIDFLYQRQTGSNQNLAIAATKVLEASFSKVWDKKTQNMTSYNLERDAKRPSLMA